MDLHPEPWNETMVELSAVSESVRAKLNAQKSAASLATTQAIGPLFKERCVQDGPIVRCSFWLWHSKEQERGIEVRIPTHVDRAHSVTTEESDNDGLPSGSVVAQYVVRRVD
jgi:hypothetical protein